MVLLIAGSATAKRAAMKRILSSIGKVLVVLESLRDQMVSQDGDVCLRE